MEVWWCKDRSWSFCFPHLSALTDEEQFLSISYVVHMMTWWHQAGDHNILVTVRVLQSGSLCCASSLPCMMTSMTTQYDQAGWGCQGQGGILWSPAPALTSPCLYCVTCLSWSASSWMVGTLGKYIQYCNFLDSQNNPVFHIVDDMIIPAARPGPDQPSLECSVVAAQW